MVWVSAWGDRANHLLSPILGLPPWSHVPFPDTDFPPGEKVPAVDVFVGDRACAWVEDLMTPEAYEWSAGRAAPTMLIDTDPAIGLTRDMVDRLLKWSRAQTGG